MGSSAAILKRSPLVGRDAELRGIASAIGRAASGRGGAVLVSGEPGIGKTRLVEEATIAATARDFIVLAGRAHAMEGELGYACVVEAFGKCLDALSPKRRAVLVAGLPELGLLFRELPVPPQSIADPALERTRLFSAVATLLERLAAEAPVLVTLDDLHWADRASLELLHYAERTLDGQRVLWLMTCRQSLDDATGPLRKLLQSLRRLELLEEVTLSRLPASSVTEMARAILGGGPPQDLVTVLHRRASGVPLFVDTLLRSLVEKGRLVSTSTGWDFLGGDRPDARAADLPQVIRDLILERLAGIEDVDRRALDAIAVSGGATSLKVLATVLGVEDRLLGARLARLVNAGILSEEREASVRYAPSHPLLVEVLYADLAEPERRRLHFAFARALDDGSQDPDTLARHQRGAGDLADPERLLEALLRAGDAALGIFADEEAAGHFAAALALLRRRSIPELLTPVLEKLGAAWQRAGKSAAAAATWAEAAELHTASGDARSAARLRHAVASALWEIGRLEDARAELDAGLALRPELPEHARLLRAKAELLERSGQLDAAETVLAELRALAVRSRVWRLSIEVDLAEARLSLARRTFGVSRAALSRALDATNERADDALRLRVHELAAAVATERLDPSAIESHTNASLELAARVGSPGSAMRAYGQRAVASFLRGRFRDAERDAESSYAVARRFQIARGLARCPTMLAMIAVQRGDLDRAAALLEEGRAASSAVEQDRYVRGTFAVTEAWLALEREMPGDPECLAVLGSESGDVWAIRVVALAELGLRKGRTAEAFAIAERLRQADDGAGCHAFAALVEGLARATIPDEDASLEALAQAHTLFQAIGADLLAARTLFEQATVLTSAKHSRADAIRLAEQARQVFEQLETRRWAERARKKLRELGERPPPARRPGPEGGPLSRRELEVATLFAQGLTTSEVAKRLIISPHTAAAHLQRIYQRLELHSRVALTRYLVENGLIG